jgi:hypothetical protein
MSPRTPRCRVTLALCALLLVTAACTAPSRPAPLGSGVPDLRFSAAQASAPVAGASQLVLAIENVGAGDDRLLGADTDAALAIEIHRTVIERVRTRVHAQLDDVVSLPEDVALPTRRTAPHGGRPGPERVVVGGTFEVTLRFERTVSDVTLTLRPSSICSTSSSAKRAPARTDRTS